MIPEHVIFQTPLAIHKRTKSGIRSLTDLYGIKAGVSWYYDPCRERAANS